MIEVIEFRDKVYPKYQSTGNATRFIEPFAREVCRGVGFDIGCNRLEWVMGDSIPIDIMLNGGEFHAHNLPNITVDYIFSSHCLEHVVDWIGALDVWYNHLKTMGVIFLYLPHYSQEYWRAWNNRKHINMIEPYMVVDYLKARGYGNIFCSGVDLNNSFAVMAEKL